MNGKYHIRSYYGQWRVTQDQVYKGHSVEVFLGVFDTHAEATGFVSLELQQDGYPFHTEKYLYHQEPCS